MFLVYIKWLGHYTCFAFIGMSMNLQVYDSVVVIYFRIYFIWIPVAYSYILMTSSLNMTVNSLNTKRILHAITIVTNGMSIQHDDSLEVSISLYIIKGHDRSSKMLPLFWFRTVVVTAHLWIFPIKSIKIVINISTLYHLIYNVDNQLKTGPIKYKIV